MSGVENPNTVDLVTHDLKTDEYALIMVETREWDGSEERLQEIRAKIENYVLFALCGQMTRLYPEASGKPIRLQLDCEIPPDAKTADFLEEVRQRLGKQGFRFIVSVGA